MAKKTNETEKKVEKMSFSILQPEEIDVPTFTEKIVSGKEFVNWGSDNKLPGFLWDMYLNSPLMSSIINGIVDYTSGAEVLLNQSLSAFNEEVNKEGDTISDLIRKISVDYAIYDGFAMQIIKNNGGELAEIYWIDIRNIRVDAERKFAYYTNKWGSYGSNDAIKYPIWKPGTKEKSTIYYFKGHHSRGVYPIPRYSGAIPSIMTDIEIGRFHLNNISNNMEPGAIVSFVDGKPPKAEQKKIEDKVKAKFSGARNAGKILITFTNGKDTAPIITRLGDDNLDKKFETLSKSTIQKIFISFRATPELFGLSTEGNGFSKEEYLQSFELFNKTVIQPMQKDITRCFNKIFDMKDSIVFKPLIIYDEINSEN